ncbi:hypothetical protein D3C72_208660 [compost metagenome]
MRFQMAVDAIVGDVCQPVLEPLDRNPSLEGRVLHLRVGLEPVDPAAMLAPELVRILDALLVPFFIFVLVDERFSLGGLENRIDFFGHVIPPSLAPST